MTALVGILLLLTLAMWLGKRTRKFNFKAYLIVAFIAALQTLVTLYAMYTMKPPL